MSIPAPAYDPEVVARDLLVAAREARATRDATWLAGYGDTGLALGGPGCPLVRESALTEPSLALGMSTTTGAGYVADALELHHRLPRLWARVLSGACPVWRARRVAAAATDLCEDGAEHVDRHLAPFAHCVSLAQLPDTAPVPPERHPPRPYRRVPDPRSARAWTTPTDLAWRRRPPSTTSSSAV